MRYLSLIVIAMLYISNATAQTNSTKVAIETSMGNIVVALYDSTPKHKANFLKLANEKLIDSTLFHRVIKDFMIQGGDVDSKHAKPGQMLGNGDLGYRVDAELMPEVYFHKKGALAAARDNNPTKASSSCQFYIVQGKVLKASDIELMEKRTGKKMTEAQKLAYTTIGGTPHLDGNYTVFGEVLEGLDVVDKIAAVQKGAADRPVEDVRIYSVKEIKKKRKKFLGIF